MLRKGRVAPYLKTFCFFMRRVLRVTGGVKRLNPCWVQDRVLSTFVREESLEPKSNRWPRQITALAVFIGKTESGLRIAKNVLTPLNRGVGSFKIRLYPVLRLPKNPLSYFYLSEYEQK